MQISSRRKRNTDNPKDWFLQPGYSLANDDSFSRAKEQLQAVIQRSDESDRAVIKGAVERLKELNDERAVFLLIEIAQYFDNVGDAESALLILESCVCKSLKLGDPNLQRKAFSNIANAHARLCDFENACLFYEKALRLANCMSDPFFRFASLCNVVALLQMMGLLNAAKHVSLELTDYPHGTPNLDYLHIQNAINGLQLSRATGDYPSARRFDLIAQKMSRTTAPVGKTWKAYVDANHAWCLCQEGLIGEAIIAIETAIEEGLHANNDRVDVILICARATNAIHSGDSKQIEASKTDLDSLLRGRRILPLHKEEILRTLVDLHSIDLSPDERKTGMAYLRELGDHLISVNHRRFFSKLSSAEELYSGDNSAISAPYYDIPTAISKASKGLDLASKSRGSVVIDEDRHVEERIFRKLSTGAQLMESQKRTRSYCIAEDWAVAADFASEHGHRHCFMVGRLARLISVQHGFSDESAVVIEMACRLHDIGKLAINETTHRAVNAGLMDEYSVVREHALVGARLLASSSDPVLQLASVVAHHHHEWWNGCGYPDGKIALEIPIEARICAVADCYVSLLRPAGSRIPWRDDVAVNQIMAMVDVQLDPDVVASFVKAIEQVAIVTSERHYVPDGDSVERGLYVAKQNLLRAIELAS